MEPEEEFLKSDFEQCFESMRHYDSQFLFIVNFIFGGFTAVIVATTALLTSTINQSARLFGSAILFFLAWASGSLLLAFLLRNRIYFVGVARYINEIRGNYLKSKPLGFENKTGIPNNPQFPVFFSPFSTHTILMYFIALANSVFLGATAATFKALFLIQTGQQLVITLGKPILVTVISIFVELLWIILYLYLKTNKPTMEVWWGKE